MSDLTIIGLGAMGSAIARAMIDQGCRLTLKPAYCIDYLCSDIRDTLEPEELAELERRTQRLHAAVAAIRGG